MLYCHQHTKGFTVMVPGSLTVMLTCSITTITYDLAMKTEVIKQKACISLLIKGSDHEGRTMYGKISAATGGTVTESIDQDVL